MQGKFDFKSRQIQPEITIYTDGGCVPNPGYGGWSFVVFDRENIIDTQYGGVMETTNNIMEMMGVLNAIRWATTSKADAKSVVIKSDSMYVVSGCNSWRIGWKRQGWKRGPNKILANAQLWMELDAALERYPCHIEWVKGHAGERGNEMADKFAEIGRKSVF